ncbi:MAG: phosphoribosylanthranilate isomerase [Chthoniobacterales bacterium]|jgi:phosphoribosylanthranilate isomerase
MPESTNRSDAIVFPHFLSGATHSSPYVKICGVTNPQDAVAAIEFGADALGFNLFPSSKRFLRLDSARDWISALPAQIARVAVGVNPEFAEAEDWLAGDLFHALQLHGQSWYPFSSRLVAIGKPLIAAIQVRMDARQSVDLDWFHGFAVMFDGYRDGDFGGTGETFPWEILSRVKTDKPVILAGGLNAENIQAAIDVTKPYAVDVATGVESRPGKKDRAKMRDFIAAVRGI